MTYKLNVLIKHKSFEPMVKTYVYHGETKQEIVDQIETLPFHRNNLLNYGKTKFKDINGITHEWKLSPSKTD